MSNLLMEIGLAAGRFVLKRDAILRNAVKCGGLTVPQIAHLTKISNRRVRKILLRKTEPTFQEFSAILAALGFELSLEPVKFGEILQSERERREPQKASYIFEAYENTADKSSVPILTEGTVLTKNSETQETE
jgi:DNA-binding phage protein